MTGYCWMPIPLFLLFIITLLSTPTSRGLDHEEQHPEDMMRLELIHRHDPRLMIGNRGLYIGHDHVILDLYRHDRLRHSIISHRLQQNSYDHLLTRRINYLEKPTNSSTGSSIQMPILAGADYGNAEYFVRVKIGTPSQKFTLIADTGSELTWIYCKYGCGGRRANCGVASHKGRLHNGQRVFHADRSSSFKTVPCLSDMCRIDLLDLFSLTRCPTPFSPCAYDYSYIDGSAAAGIFANETISIGLTNGRKRKLVNVVIGCTRSTPGGDSFRGADGVLGLSYGNNSFAKLAADTFGGIFSYCLVDHLSPKNVSNYLIFGGSRSKQTSLSRSLRYTKLQVGGVISPFYGVNVRGVSIGGMMLKVPSQVWDINRGGGTILDSGTSLTLLAMPAYRPTMDTLIRSLSKFERLMSMRPFEYCFNSTGYEENMVPRLAFHFEDGARFQPPVKSYVIEAAPQTKCLGFVSLNWPATSIIGNILQQNHFWEFDLVTRTLAYAPSTCV